MKRQMLLNKALTLASVGLQPVPMDAQSKRPARKGWREAASLDPDAIAAAFIAAPYANALGVVTGGGIFVIDLDRNHKDGADGVAAFAALIARHGTRESLAIGTQKRLRLSSAPPMLRLLHDRPTAFATTLNTLRENLGEIALYGVVYCP